MLGVSNEMPSFAKLLFVHFENLSNVLWQSVNIYEVCNNVVVIANIFWFAHIEVSHLTDNLKWYLNVLEEYC